MSNLLAVNIGDVYKTFGTTGIGNSTAAPQFSSVNAFVAILLKNFYSFAGLILFVILIFGGISIIIGAGSGDAKKVGEGQKAASAAIIGFIIIFCSYWIIQIIQRMTAVPIINGAR